MNVRIRAVVRAILVMAVVAVSPSAFGVTRTWDAGGGTEYWSNALNWSGNAVPTSGDDVVITTTGTGTVRIDVNPTVNSITVQNGAILLIQAGELLTLNNSSVVYGGGSLRLNSANLDGPGALTVYGTVEIFGGTLDGPGSLFIQSGGLLQFWGTVNSSRLLRSTINTGTINFRDDIQAGNHFGFGGGSLQNSGTGIIDIQTDHDVLADVGSPVLTNYSGGVIKKSFGSGSAAINFTVDNAAGGTIDAQSGTLALNGGGNVQGQYSISSGATLNLSGGQFTMANNTTLTGPGTLHTSGGNLVLNGGTLTMTGNPAVNGSIAIAGGTLDADASVSVTWTDFAIYSGSVTGGGDLHVSGNFNWFGGTISGSGGRILNGGSSPTISCSPGNCLLNGATLQLQASATFSASTNPLVLSNGASLTIDAGKTLSVTNDGDVTDGGGAASSIVNNGTIWKQTASGTSTIGVPMQLSGTSTVQIDTGTLQFGGGANIASGATLNIAAGKTLEITGGVFQFNSGTVSMPGSGNFTVSSGTLRVPASTTMTVSNVTLQGSGVIDGAGTLILSGTSNWLGGTMGSAAAPGGITQIDFGNGMNITPVVPASLTQARQLLNNGTVAYGSLGANILTMSGNSTITNNFALNFNDGTINVSGSALIDNFGTITKVAGAGTIAISPPLNNNPDAVVSAPAGTIALSGGGVASGTYLISSGATVALTSGTFAVTSIAAVTGAGLLSIAGATLDAGAGVDLTCPKVALSAGTITGVGTLRMSGDFAFSGGTIAGSGMLFINSGATMEIGPASVVPVISRSVTNAGTITVLTTCTVDTTFDGATLTNTGTIDIQNGHNIKASMGSPILNNNSGGVIRKSINSGITEINFPVNNAAGATIESQIGHLYLNGGGTDSGIYSIFSGSQIRLGPNVTTVTMSGTPTVTGSGTLNIVGATLDAGAGVDVTIPNLNLEHDFATVTGAGAVRVSGNFTWSAGKITGSGPRVLNSTSTPSFPCDLGNCVLDAATLLLQANSTDSASSHAFVLSNGASLTIDPGKTLSITNNGDFTNGGGAASSIINNGTIWKKTAAGTSTIAVPVTLSGTSTVDIDAGTLQFGGDTSVASGATIDIAASGRLEVTGGVFLFNSGSVTMPGSGTFSVSAGTLRVPTGITVTVPKVTLEGSGVIDGAGTLILSGVSEWDSGSMGSAAAPGGVTQIDSGNTLDMDNFALSNTLTQGRELRNSGTVNYGGGSSPLTMSGASKITNNGAFHLIANRNINVSGNATIDNNGTLDKSGGSGTSTLFPAVNNAGTVSATTGTLVLAGGGTNSGSINVTAPANLSFSSGTLSVSGGSIGGSGTLTFNGAAATIGVPVNVGALHVTAGTATLNANGSADAFTMSGGTLGGSGTFTLNNGGTWSGGTMSGSGTTANPATKSLGISAPVTLNSRTLQNDGTLNVSGGIIAGTGTINNIGAINDTAGATISAPMNNSGQVTTSALLSLAGGGTHSGTFTASSPASVIDFSGGAHTISGAFAGPGKFRFSGGTEAVNGAWSGKTIDIAGGSVALNTSGTLPALSLTGGTLAGSGNLTVTGASTWSGGTIAGSAALTFDAGATVTMPGTSAATLSRPLLNNGTINFTAASSAMLIDGVPITNSGTFDIQSSQSILVTPGTPPFINNGTLRKSSGAGVMQFDAPLANTGLVQIGAGTLNFSGTYTQTAGTTEVQPGATLQTGTLSLNGGSLIGNGTIAGTVDNHALVAPGASPGTLTINGDYVQASNGVLNIQIGGTAPGSQYDQLLVTGNVTLGGSLNVLPINSFVPAAGNAFQILTFGARPAYTSFANINGLAYGSGTALVPTYNANDLQLITNNVQADLAASVSAPPSAAIGSTFAYTVSILNQGGSDATGVSFSAALPPNVTFSSASPAICSAGPNLVCTIGALANQSAAVVVLNVTANAPGAAPITISSAGNEFDPNTANNTASASPSITAAADLSIAVTGTPSTVAGSRAVYTIIVTNNGPDAANNVAVNAAASAGLTFSANGGACTGSFPCNLGSLSSGQSATITSAWDISPAAAGSVQLTVNVTSAAPDPNPSNNSAAATTQIGTCPAIVIITPSELTSGASAQASATLFGGAAYNWSISDGTIDRGNGTDTITFTAGAAGTATLAVDVIGAGCTLRTSVLITVKPRLTCQGTAAPTAPAGGTTTANAVVAFTWTAIDGASGYRLWLRQGDAPVENLGVTRDTSLTTIIPPGAHHWYVETLFDGCASHESEHLALTILPAQDCDTRGAPQLTAPAIDTTSTSATIAFRWDALLKAIQYELWLAPAGGLPTLIRVTSDTSYTSDVPPGRLEWYVRAIFGGCGATESARQTFIYTPPPECTSQRPLLIAPAEGERLTSPVSFEWREVPGAASYELSIDGGLAATTTSPHATGIAVPLDERRWRVRAILGQNCGALDSAESRFVALAPSPSCASLEPPVLTAPGQISSGVTARIQWTFVAGATGYVVQTSNDPSFSRASTDSSTVVTRELPFTFTNDGNVPVARYVRVYAIDTECVVPASGPFSPAALISVLPRTGTAGAALLSDPADVEYTLTIGADLAGLGFTATPTAPWLTVTPSTGIVPPGGQTLHAVAHTAGLPAGASTGTVIITTAAAAGTRVALGNPPPLTVPITVSNIPGVTTKPKSTPPPDALTIPAVANVKNFIVRYQSDVCVTNTSAQVIKYEINFVPTGLPGISQGQTTTASIEPGVTLALNDIVTTWFGGLTTSGMLEIRPLTEIDTSTSSAPASGLADRVTFASSRTFAVAPDGGTYGQYVPAVPYANFISKGSIISLQQIAQSDQFRTNLGLVEGSGEAVTVQVRIFDSAGTMVKEFPVDLTGGQHTQLNEVLKTHGGIVLDDGRIEVEVVKGAGKVTAYASVIGSDNNDPLLIPPVTIGDAGHSKWVVPGVAGLTGGSSNWQSDVRIFNAGKDPADLTLVFYSRNGGTATTKTTTLAAGEVRQFNRVLSSFFGISQDAGALHVSSAAPARLVVTTRTYNETGQGAYGQFIPAATPEDAVSAGSRPLQILQVEQSAQYRSNIGFAEVSGKAVTLEVSVFPPGHPTALLEVKLAPNEFRQMDSLLSTLDLANTFNARISVRVKEGEGRATAYLSLIDLKSGDPTYVPGQ